MLVGDGRSILDTAGMCVTRTSYQEIPVYKWVPGAGMSIGGNVSSEGGTSLTASASGGVDVSGTSGGIRYEINNITAHAIQLRTYFSMLSGTATITIWQGTTVGVGGTQLGSTTSSFTSPAPVINTSVGGTTTVPKTITVVVSMGTGSYRSLFSVDSIGYQTFSWTVGVGMYTTCGEPKDHYEFGYNGQMKSNEIAGMGNHNTALFWEYDTRLGRRWNLDPKPNNSISSYAGFANNPLLFSDIHGDSINKRSNFAGPNAKNVMNSLFANGCSGLLDEARNCDLCCLNAFASNLSALFQLSYEDFKRSGTFEDALETVGEAGYLGDRVVVQPTLNGKKLESKDAEDFRKSEASTNVVENLQGQMKGHKGIFAFAVGLAYGYHSTVIVAYNNGQRISDENGEVHKATKNQPIFVFIEDAGGTRVFNAKQLEAKLMEFYIGAAGYYSGSRAVAGRTVENNESKNMGAIIYNLQAKPKKKRN